ncbi:DUF4760 domain-containing protein [Phytohalomonas tamaricis]|uniref:DUF4760 domain-containing protein n=1 Tax=Phytohalomonas tamaricis TaxID=2081032 RepID=UPI000D0AC6B2|nr:DUF4760 domain-containing protein [Phytohalomonas tamaricis]
MDDTAQVVWTAPEIVRTALMALAVLVAIVSVLSVKNTAKKKQTADLLFNVRSDERLIRATHALLELHESNENIRLWADPGRKGEEKVQDVRYVLNHYERLSVGLQERIYHERMLKNSQYTIITKTYAWSKPFIEGVREKTGSETAFQEFEWLATRWQKSPLKKKRS